MCILPSDHFIKDGDEFTKVLEAASKAVEQTDALVTVGIQPTYAATGYGYIRSKQNSGTEIDGTNNKNYFFNFFVHFTHFLIL